LLARRTLRGDSVPNRTHVRRSWKTEPEPGTKQLHVSFAPFGRDIRLENLD